MANNQPRRIKTISEYHQIMGLPKPEHPLISVIDFESIKHLPSEKISQYLLRFLFHFTEKKFQWKNEVWSAGI